MTAAAGTITALVLSELWSDAVAAIAAFASGAVLVAPRHRPGADPS